MSEEGKDEFKRQAAVLTEAYHKEAQEKGGAVDAASGSEATPSKKARRSKGAAAKGSQEVMDESGSTVDSAAAAGGGAQAPIGSYAAVAASDAPAPAGAFLGAGADLAGVEPPAKCDGSEADKTSDQHTAAQPESAGAGNEAADVASVTKACRWGLHTRYEPLSTAVSFGWFELPFSNPAFLNLALGCRSGEGSAKGGSGGAEDVTPAGGVRSSGLDVAGDEKIGVLSL